MTKDVSNEQFVEVTEQLWELLLTHPKVQEAYQYYATSMLPPMRRSKDSIPPERRMTFEGVTYVCNR